MTALTINMAVLDLKFYKWCKMNNWSHSTSARSREHVSPCFEYKGRQWNKYREWCTKVDILHITVTYLTATINRTTRKWEPETATDGSSQTRQTCRLTGTGTGLARQESPGRVFGSFWNRTEPFFRSKPGPLAGYLDPLLTLTINGSGKEWWGSYVCELQCRLWQA